MVIGMRDSPKFKALWGGIRCKKTFIRAFPEVREAVAQMYHDGWSQFQLSRIIGVPAYSIYRWAMFGREKAKTDMRSNPEFQAIRDQMLKELKFIRETCREKRHVPRKKEAYNPQEDFLDDEWELEDP